MNKKYLEMPWDIEQTIQNLKDIKEHLQRQVISRNMDGRGKKDAEECAYDFDRAINALETQIPIKPSPVPNRPTPDASEGAFFCPICSEELSDDFEFCPLCGKKIDWND